MPQLSEEYIAQWQAASNTADLNALSSIRSTAEKWGTTISALFGAFAFVTFIRGPGTFDKLKTPDKNWITGLLIGGLALALIAIVTAAFAAQGIPFNTFNNATVFRDNAMRRARNASDLLRVSRISGPLAVAAVFAALLWSWNAPPKTEKASVQRTYFVLHVTGPVQCGDLVTKGGIVQLRVGNVRTRPIERVTQLISVKRCP